MAFQKQIITSQTYISIYAITQIVQDQCAQKHVSRTQNSHYEMH